MDDLDDLIKRLRHIEKWDDDDFDVEDRFNALKDAGLLRDAGLDEFSFDSARQFAEEEGQDIRDVFLTDQNDLYCPYYRYDEILQMEGVQLLDNLSSVYPVLADHEEDFSVVIQLIKRQALEAVAQENRVQSELADPEEVRANRARGRSM
ncbi:MAG: hypothetical protein EOO16_03205 [Chitinophagaceae bacterium]|nr:MAG: hypothetical protein EOO16_03205 [Chitinophagaceae bacterium]